MEIGSQTAGSGQGSGSGPGSGENGSGAGTVGTGTGAYGTRAGAYGTRAGADGTGADPREPGLRRDFRVGGFRRRDVRLLAALAVAVVIAAWFATRSDGQPAVPPAGAVPGIQVNVAGTGRSLDPAAIGVTGASVIGAGVSGPGVSGSGDSAGKVGEASLALLKRLQLGYSGATLSPASAAGTAVTGGSAGRVPVAVIPDSVSPAAAATLVRKDDAGPAPVRDWEITARSGEGAVAFSTRFNALSAAMTVAAAQDPVTHGSAADSAGTRGPVADGSVADGPVADGPVADGPVARRPVTDGAAAHGITIGADIGSYSRAFLTAFLKGSGSKTDFIGFGFYGQKAGETATNGQLIAALPALAADLSSARALIDQLVRGGTGRVAIRVDGWDIAGDASAPVRFTSLAATWDADALGRILTGGAASLANGASGRLVYDGSGTAPRAYQAGGPTPLYEAIGMFTGEGLFPGFGGRTVPVTTSLPGVDAFAAVSGAGSAARDEIVVVNTSGSSPSTIVRVTGTGGEAGPLRAAQWRLPTVNGAVSTPASAGSATSDNGSFELTLPSGSVTTIVITPAGSESGGSDGSGSGGTENGGTGNGGPAAGDVTTVTSAATGQCLAESARGVSTAPCDGAAPQKWRLSGTALVNVSTGHCLAASPSGQVSAAPCANSAGQAWYSLGSRLVSARTGRCLNGNITGETYVLACDGARQQNWTLGS